MNRLINFFRGVKTLPKITKPCQVVIINDEKKHELLIDVLGITEARATQLIQAMLKKLKETNCVALTFVDVSAMCKHPNELAYMSFCFGQTYEKRRNPLGGLFGGLSKIFGK